MSKVKFSAMVILMIVLIVALVGVTVYVVRFSPKEEGVNEAKLISAPLSLIDPVENKAITEFEIPYATDRVDFLVVECSMPPVNFKNSDLILTFKVTGVDNHVDFVTVPIRGGLLESDINSVKEFSPMDMKVELNVGHWGMYPEAVESYDLALTELKENQLLLFMHSTISGSYDSSQRYVLSDFSIIGIAG